MRTCDSVIQNARKMCVWRDSQYSMLRREQSSSSNTYIPMTLVQKREKADSRVQTCAKSDIEQFSSHRADLGFSARVKNLGFSWPVHFSLASSAKIDIVKVEKTQMD